MRAVSRRRMDSASSADLLDTILRSVSVHTESAPRSASTHASTKRSLSAVKNGARRTTSTAEGDIGISSMFSMRPNIPSS